MIIGICTCEIFIFNANSLKSKRSVVKSIIEKSKNRFNISIAEVGENDKWQKSIIAFSTISNDQKIVEETIEKVINFFDSYSEIEIININREIL
ncbi:MAG: DUF503 domain-containing protein [Peptoniphilus harei]|uniref:DUF503 domain-containing protein n=1 Tax=Peptoniphilus genitalis TaxID=3036303 RepID=A0ABY4TLV1_9FIRM|nr:MULTISPECIES: DUF503 domain-containing protein [Peptoniphilus]MDK7755247.1 DUF503 domain-containing protein [Peptoniphilus harei]MDK7761481.1 DUF503 domain-containing protein [Peptoniphilus harei]MDK8271007.1 DUF503 domain-containing protein [Peptoniphilus harei]MDK8339405.1 DUF503 domain-containing protein [Peptoniphilus harei]MDU2503111.1 DUF503 domain-containing protein [Peptoniphilus harei]